MSKMKYVLLFVVIVLCALLVTTSYTFAHPGGGPPFLKINGVYADTDSYSPQLEDISQSLYEKGEELLFEIDTTALNVPPKIV